MAIVIDLKSTDSTVEQRLDSVIAKLDRLNAALLQVRANFTAAAASGTQFARATPRGRGTGGGGSHSARSQRTQAPPFDHNAVLNDPVMRARVLAGDPQASLLFNRATGVQRRVTRAQNSVNPPGFGQNFQNMLMRSRFGGGGGAGGVMPLGMDMVKLMGGSKAAGPIGVAVALVAIKIKVLSAMFKKAADAAKQFSEAMVGGGASGAGAAVVLGGITGLGPGGAAGAVRGRGGRETAFGASRGIDPLAGDPFLNPGGANKAYQKMAEAVAKAADRGGFAAAQAEASRLGAPELARLGLLSQDARNTVLASGDTPGNTAAAVAFTDLWANISVFAKEFGTLVKTYMLPWLKVANSLFKHLNDLLVWLNTKLAAVLGGTGLFGELDKTMDKHDQAMNEHTRAMNEHAEYLGGGRRVQGAVPRNVQGNPAAWLQRDAFRESMRLGAI